MASNVDRRTVDLSAYPDLVVMYLGMRVNALTGFRTVFKLGPQIDGSVRDRPDGLLLHEQLIFSLFPPHVGMRQYWRDFESLERWSRSEPHRRWWKDFLRNSGGTGFWHETYFMRGGMEAIYDDMPHSIGLGRFAVLRPARSGMYSARRRLKVEGQELDGVVSEEELYDRAPAATTK
ncbi:DUF4188 domain-containing protein [Deinococcus pimensis]|uniref:DUF4188 domain-containing protein n=1 Tax=Deinococcus pimensis TaxID=309888 RepID=UPI0004831A8D|nr:DUF4188 domain-containing protein [Deinococcus pimensis]